MLITVNNSNRRGHDMNNTFTLKVSCTDKHLNVYGRGLLLGANYSRYNPILDRDSTDSWLTLVPDSNGAIVVSPQNEDGQRVLLTAPQWMQKFGCEEVVARRLPDGRIVIKRPRMDLPYIKRSVHRTTNGHAISKPTGVDLTQVDLGSLVEEVRRRKKLYRDRMVISVDEARNDVSVLIKY